MNRINSNTTTPHPIIILGEVHELATREKVKHNLCRKSMFNFLFLLLVTFYVPVTLIWTGILPFEYRFHALFFILAGFIAYCFLKRYSFHELGFRTDNLSSSLLWNLLFSAIGVLILYCGYKTGLFKNHSPTYLPTLYIFYIFFLGPVQELLFRGVLFAEMKRIKILNSKWILFISSCSFCFLHIIYNHPPLLIISLISGLIWGTIFIKSPNIWGISISHSLLGAVAMFLGIF